jgi:adhesin transport system outer membrane protein
MRPLLSAIYFFSPAVTFGGCGARMNMNFKRLLCLGTALSLVLPTASFAMSLRESIQIALQSSPEIGQAAANREAIEFELRQAVGLYSPRVDLEASTGVQLLGSPSRKAAGIDNDALYPSQVAVVATFDLLDGGYRDSETNRQAARVDGASFRVLERSEFVALQVSRVYFQVLLQGQIVALSRENVAFHNTMLSDVGAAIESGQLTEADRFQAIERLAASRARLTEAGVELEAARIEFNLYVGLPPANPTMPSRIGADLPKSLDAAIALSRLSNPRMLLAGADIDAASAQVEQAKSGLAPKVLFEARAATGLDIGGADGATSDVSARLTMRWNIYDGGIKNAQVQEGLRRESEAMLVLDQTSREVEEAVRTSWLRLRTQSELSSVYAEQLKSTNNLIDSYREQFRVGGRSLLDVLDAQNTGHNVRVLYETARISRDFAEYRLLASSGALLRHYKLEAPAQSDAYARNLMETPSWTESAPRTMTPLDLTSFVK